MQRSPAPLCQWLWPDQWLQSWSYTPPTGTWPLSKKPSCPAMSSTYNIKQISFSFFRFQSNKLSIKINDGSQLCVLPAYHLLFCFLFCLLSMPVLDNYQSTYMFMIAFAAVVTADCHSQYTGFLCPRTELYFNTHHLYQPLSLEFYKKQEAPNAIMSSKAWLICFFKSNKCCLHSDELFAFQ